MYYVRGTQRACTWAQRVCVCQQRSTAKADVGSAAGSATGAGTCARVAPPLPRPASIPAATAARAAPAPPAPPVAPAQAQQARQRTPRLSKRQQLVQSRQEAMAKLEAVQKALQALSKQFDQQQALLRITIGAANAATGEDASHERLLAPFRTCADQMVALSRQTAQALRSARTVGRGDDGEQAIRDARVRVSAGVRRAGRCVGRRVGRCVGRRVVLVAVSCWSPCRVGRRGHLLAASLTVWLRRVQVREVSEGLVESATRLLCSQRKAAGDAYMMLGQVRTRFGDAEGLQCFDQAVTLFQVRTPHRVAVDCNKCLTACMMLWVVCLAGRLGRAQTAYSGSNITRDSMYNAHSGDVPRNVAELRASPSFGLAVNAFLAEATCLSTRAQCRLKLAGLEDRPLPCLQDMASIRAAQATATPTQCVTRRRVHAF